MPGGGQLLRRIMHPVGPAAQVPRPSVARHQDRVARAGAADGIDERLEAGHLPGSGCVTGAAALLPAIPADVVRLVEEIEDHCGIAPKNRGHRAPEGRCVISIGHLAALARPTIGGERPLRAPVQVHDGVQTGRVEAANVGADRLAIIRTAVGGGRAVDAEPAILVQRNANRVDVPGSHRGDRRGIIRTIEAAPPVHARVFTARPVDAE